MTSVSMRRCTPSPRLLGSGLEGASGPLLLSPGVACPLPLENASPSTLEPRDKDRNKHPNADQIDKCLSIKNNNMLILMTATSQGLEICKAATARVSQDPDGFERPPASHLHGPRRFPRLALLLLRGVPVPCRERGNGGGSLTSLLSGLGL